MNGKQLVKLAGGDGLAIPQCEVILTHTLVCRKTKKEFIVNKGKIRASEHEQKEVPNGVVRLGIEVW